MDRVLVVVPLGANANRIRTETVQSILSLEWPGVLDILWQYSGHGEKHFDDLARKFNAAAGVCRSGGYDAMCIIEYDMIVPADALLKLSVVDADVAYGLYCSRNDAGHRWLIAKHIEEHAIEWPDRDELLRYWGNIVPSSGVGTGCTFIHDDALDAITFRSGGAAPDWYLAVDARRAGLKQVHHGGVVCGHILGDQGAVWPDANMPGLYRMEVWPKARELSERNLYRLLPGQAITAGDGKSIYKAGQLITLNHGQAAVMLRKGVVECV